MESAEKKSLTVALARRLFVFGIAPNLFYFIVSHYVYVMRPVVNVDYLALGMLEPFIPRAALFVLYALLFLNGLLINAMPLFHFRLSDILFSFNNASGLKLSFVAPIIAVSLLAAFGFACLMIKVLGKRIDRLRSAPALMAFAGILCCGLDVLNGTSFLPLQKRIFNFDCNVAHSGTRKTIMAVRDALNAEKLLFEPLKDEQHATGVLFDALKRDPARLQKRIAVIVVESMGLYLDKDVAAELRRALTSRIDKNRYRVAEGTAPFYGMTIDGEYRELCGVRIFNRSPYGVPTCLPKMLKEKGYETLAFHGFTSAFFQRNVWYPELGFEKTFFAEDLYGSVLKRKCGAGFTGMCDVDVARLVKQELKEKTDKPKFVYWMTLNSHWPLDSASSASSHFECGRFDATGDNLGLCQHARMIHLVLEKIGKMAADPDLPDTEFVIVGDHSPPFIDKETRALFSQTSVPYFTITPDSELPRLSQHHVGSGVPAGFRSYTRRK